MTLQGSRWLLVPLGIGAAAAVLVLPPRALPERITLAGEFLGFGARRWQQDVQDEHRWSIERAHDRLRERIGARAHGSADVLASRSLHALRSSVEPLVIVRDAEVPEAAGRAWLQAAERELALAPRAGAQGVPVIVALHTRAPAELSGSMGTEVLRDRFQYESGTTRACIVDIVLPRQAMRGRSRFDVPPGRSGSVLGRCALYARFGFPGREIQRWAGLEAGWSGRWWWYGDEGSFASLRGIPDTLRFRYEYSDVPWAELACFRGLDAYCASLAGLTSVPGVGQGGAFYYYYFGWRSLPSTGRFLADLILERGPEPFVRFWSSSLPPDSALHVAYGVPAGVLARNAFARRFVPAPMAQPSLREFLVAGGWAVVLAALAMALSWRREMDA